MKRLSGLWFTLGSLCFATCLFCFWLRPYLCGPFISLSIGFMLGEVLRMVLQINDYTTLHGQNAAARVIVLVCCATLIQVSLAINAIGQSSISNYLSSTFGIWLMYVLLRHRFKQAKPETEL